MLYDGSCTSVSWAGRSGRNLARNCWRPPTRPRPSMLPAAQWRGCRWDSLYAWGGERFTTLHYTTLHYTTLHYTTPHYTTLHYTTLHYTTLHYTTLHYTQPCDNSAAWFSRELTSFLRCKEEQLCCDNTRNNTCLK